MTSIAVSLDVDIKAAGREFKPSFSFSGAIPDETVTLPGPDGTALVITQSDAGVNLALHLPILGNVYNHTFSEKVSHSISETYDGQSVTGSVSIS
jgi:hypothetical protein